MSQFKLSQLTLRGGRVKSIETMSQNMQFFFFGGFPKLLFLISWFYSILTLFRWMKTWISERGWSEVMGCLFSLFSKSQVGLEKWHKPTQQQIHHKFLSRMNISLFQRKILPLLNLLARVMKDRLCIKLSRAQIQPQQ